MRRNTWGFPGFAGKDSLLEKTECGRYDPVLCSDKPSSSELGIFDLAKSILK